MLFDELEQINRRPRPFEFYTAADLWTDDYISEQMLAYHLNEEIDLASRKITFINRSVEWITAFFNVRPGMEIADFGCGPGLYTSRLAQKQAELTGIDFSPRSIRYARESATREQLTIRYVLSNYLDYSSDERYDLLLLIYCDFCALSPAQRKTLLSRFQTFLKPGGRLLLDVLSLQAFQKAREKSLYEFNLMHQFWSPHPYYGFLNSFKYESVQVLLDKYTIIEAGRTRTVYNWLQCFSPESLEREMADCGLTVERRLGDVAGSAFDPESQEFAVVVRRT
jgi:SAM-dependent methyltransferase